VTFSLRVWNFRSRERSAIWSLTVGAAKTLVQAFIACHLDCCNFLLQGVSDGLMRKVQSIQNAAVHLITGTKRCDHVTPVLRQLHWLPVRQRVMFIVACLVHQSLLYRPKPIHCNYQLAHYSGFCRISPSILNRFKPNLQA